MKTLVLAFAVFPLFVYSQSLTVPANGTHRFTTSTIQLDELIVGPNAILSFQTDEREVVFKCKYVKIGEGVMINGRGGMGSSGESPSNGDSGSNCRSGEPGRAGGAGERGGQWLGHSYRNRVLLVRAVCC